MLGNKDAFYSEGIEIPSDAPVDRSAVYAFLCQRMDLTYLMDYYYSCADPQGNLPNAEIWPHVLARVESMKAVYAGFPEVIKSILGFIPETYTGR